jgi:diphthamide biosynthesis protein 2
LDCIRHLQRLIRESGRRCCTVAIGKLNAAKIANFVGIDIFVMVACPMSCIIDSFEFNVDIVTPVDIDLALNT